MSNSEVAYSYKSSDSELHHIVKANYIESSYSLTEEYHQTVSGSPSKSGAFCFEENDETIWHSVIINSNLAYFLYNTTSFSLITNKYASTEISIYSSLEMEAVDGFV